MSKFYSVIAGNREYISEGEGALESAKAFADELSAAEHMTVEVTDDTDTVIYVSEAWHTTD